MKANKFLASIFVLHFTMILAQNNQLKIPKGWRKPNELDIQNRWFTKMENKINPYFVKADFDNNGLIDEAWILIKKDNTKFGIWIFLNKKQKQINYLIDEKNLYYVKPQDFNIAKSETGSVLTACGKGYYDCAPGELSELYIKSPQLWHSPLEQGPGFITMWIESEQIFRTYQISD